MKPTLIISVLIFTLASAFYFYQINNRFDQNHFINKSFSIDLGKFLESYDYTEKNGLLIIANVNISDPLFVKLMAEGAKLNSEFVQATYFGEGIGSNHWGPTVYKKWGSFDQFSKMTLYYEKPKTLLIGYFDGFGG